MTVHWTATALNDLESLHEYVAGDSLSLSAAIATVERILAAIEALKRHPEMGRTGRVAGSRELVVAPYVIAYRHSRGRLDLLAVIHGARRWPEKF